MDDINQSHHREIKKMDLDVTKANNAEEYARLIATIKKLNEEMGAYRAKATFNRKKCKNLELLLKKTRQERDTSNALLTETRQTLQEFQGELQRMNRSRNEAWSKASESSAELEVMKQQLNSLKSQFQQKVSDLQDQILCQTEASDSLKQTQAEENNNLQKALDEALHKIEIDELTIYKLKKKIKGPLKEKIYLKKKIYQQAKMHKLRVAKHNIKLESNRKKIELLRQENARLRELQTGTNSQAGTDSDRVLKQLSHTIKILKTKLDKSERQVKRYNRLKCKRQVQKSAIDILSDDLETLNKKKALLTQEKDRLLLELRELKGKHFYTQEIHENSQKKAGLSMKMLQL